MCSTRCSSTNCITMQCCKAAVLHCKQALILHHCKTGRRHPVWDSTILYFCTGRPNSAVCFVHRRLAQARRQAQAAIATPLMRATPHTFQTALCKNFCSYCTQGVYLLGEVSRKAHHEDVAKLVSSTEGVVVKLQLGGEVARSGVICIDVQLVLSLLVLHEED